MFVAALVACTLLHHCYRYGLYSNQEFASKEDCLKAFGFVATTLRPADISLRFQCMSKKEWLLLPAYPRKA